MSASTETVDRDTMPGREPLSMRLVVDPPPRTSALAAARIGITVGLSRMARRPTALALLLAFALAVAGALIQRASDPVSAATAALGGTFRLVLPLLAFALVGEVTERGRLDEATWAVARFGIARRDAALGLLLAAAAVAALTGALSAIVTLVFAHGNADPPLARDAVQCAWIAALTSAAYVGWFGFGATFFRRGGGRWVPLALDFILGSSSGIIGAVLPRGNALNLLGGAAPLGLSQPTSSVLLTLMIVVLGLLAALRCGD